MSRHILLIQDDVPRATAIQAALGESGGDSYQVEWVRTCAAGLERLNRCDSLNQVEAEDQEISAVLVDLELPDCQGIETFDRLFSAVPQTPILVLTAVQDEAIARTAVQRGAQEYLLHVHLDGYLLPKTLGRMLERSAISEALYCEREQAQVTLNSIGDAVISTNIAGQVTFLNPVAETLTGWSQQDAVGRPLQEVFTVVDAATREVAANPMARALHENRSVALTPDCTLIRRDGTEIAIEDSAAPIRDRRGRVTGAVMVFRDVSVARAMALRMSHLAQHDSLTDLPNRVLMNDRLADAIVLSGRYKRKLAVLFLDLDRFKNINDSLGHPVGDRLLQSVALRLFTCVRSSDAVSRQGGDEFVILLWEVKHAEDAAITAEKILQSLRAPYFIDEHELHVTASIGIVTYPADGEDAETLLRHADFAMYHAKESGRDGYQFFKPHMKVRAMERQSLEGDLRHAIERQELSLFYQPKIDLMHGARTITGVEALIRWQHPRHGLMFPQQFIGIAEDCGYIATIGRWVLREACGQARAWQDGGFLQLPIAVNVSAVELRAKGFVAGVQAILQETGLEARLLELEITETFLMQDSRAVADVLGDLKDIGVCLALDDFGTGYSSLSYLKRFPIDTLKIDRSFVRDLVRDTGDASIVSAVIGMGRNLRMRVVAEGVETREQLEFLRNHGCPQGQGYYIGRPVSAEEFGRRLTSNQPLATFS